MRTMWPSWLVGVSNGSDINPPNGVVVPLGRVLDQLKLPYISNCLNFFVKLNPYRLIPPRFAEGVYRMIAGPSTASPVNGLLGSTISPLNPSVTSQARATVNCTKLLSVEYRSKLPPKK